MDNKIKPKIGQQDYAWVIKQSTAPIRRQILTRWIEKKLQDGKIARCVGEKSQEEHKDCYISAASCK